VFRKLSLETDQRGIFFCLKSQDEAFQQHVMFCIESFMRVTQTRQVMRYNIKTTAKICLQGAYKL
jgi:hypothetical protein